MMDMNPDIVAALNRIDDTLSCMYYQFFIVSMVVIYHVFWGKR